VFSSVRINREENVREESASDRLLDGCSAIMIGFTKLKFKT
jgi:hypothetical protein